MKKIFLLLLVSTITIASFAQSVNDIITQQEVERIETALAADDMMGRKAFTAGSEKAAAFISNEFKKIGLQNLEGVQDYKQQFTMVKSKFKSLTATFNTKVADNKNIIVVTCLPELAINQKSNFKEVFIKEGADLRKEASEYGKLKENLLVFVDESFSKNFGRLTYLKRYLFKSDKSVVFVLGRYNTDNFEITATHEITEEQGTNVVGVLPGKNKKAEYVIFSGHYDHLGTGKAVNNDSIFNGANDDASGITAVIAMAKYYKAAKANDRTLIFVAFTAEELGGFGSKYFSEKIDANKAIAMFNLEMIGTESKWGKNSAYITGFDKTNMGEILQKNLTGSQFKFYADPYTEQDLFYRSDNATLAELGVPAHTISTSKMDNEANYHKLTDEVTTLDLVNMTEIIKSVVISAKSIVEGKDTPTRVKPE